MIFNLIADSKIGAYSHSKILTLAKKAVIITVVINMQISIKIA
jgi:hypothetical protein